MLIIHYLELYFCLFVLLFAPVPVLPPSLCGMQALAALIAPPVADCGAFVRAHLQMDLQQLTRALGKGADDTAASVHIIINALLDPPPAACEEIHKYTLTEKHKCTHTHTHYVAHLDRLKEAM